jgi:hypothetical protein
VSLQDAGRTTLKPEDAAQLQLAASTGVRVVVSVYGWGDDAPRGRALCRDRRDGEGDAQADGPGRPAGGGDRDPVPAAAPGHGSYRAGGQTVRSTLFRVK